MSVIQSKGYFQLCKFCDKSIDISKNTVCPHCNGDQEYLPKVAYRPPPPELSTDDKILAALDRIEQLLRDGNEKKVKKKEK